MASGTGKGEVMDNFKVIYRILRAFERSMDNDEFNEELISPDQLGISNSRWKKIMKMLSDERYLDGVIVIETNAGELIVKLKSPSITLKGLEYLNENSLMKKAANIAKGISDMIP